MTLVPCAGCRRHVRDDASTCPFCDHVAATPRPDDGARFSAPQGMSRAQVLALGLLAATAATGCSTISPAPVYGGPPPNENATAVPAYGMPVPAPPATSASAAPAQPGPAKAKLQSPLALDARRHHA